LNGGVKTSQPFDHKTIQLQNGTMHCVDEEEGDPILFVHGTPTGSFLYRKFVRYFSKTNRAVAIDHLGFGLSEKPETFFDRPEKILYSIVIIFKLVEE
jgi:pimeloyl-ACP methyl ester carboxylesterase